MTAYCARAGALLGNARRASLQSDIPARRRLLVSLAAWAAAAAVAIVCLDRLRAPYPWIALAVVVALGVDAALASGPRVRLALVYAAAAVLALGAAEAWLDAADRARECRVDYPAGYQVRDDLLGGAPGPGSVAHVRKTCGPRTVYDVTYTIDGAGLRVGPPGHDGPADGAVLLFGCSFTFGEGVSDRDALAYRLETLLPPGLHAYALAFHGYGPHQMLAMLEHERERAVVHGTPREVVFLSVRDHVRRVAGLASYGKAAPRYVLDGAGPHQAGRLGDVVAWPQRLPETLRDQLEKSALLRETLLRPRADDARDVELDAAIVARARDIVESRYPGCRFDVLHWDTHRLDATALDARQSDALVRALRARGLHVHLVSAILPDPESARWVIDPLDRHPSAAADDALAHYVAEHLVGSSP